MKPPARAGESIKTRFTGKKKFTHTSKVRSDVIGSKPMSKKTEINVAGKRLTVSSLEKVLYPEVGFTKGQVIDYLYSYCTGAPAASKGATHHA